MARAQTESRGSFGLMKKPAVGTEQSLRLAGPIINVSENMVARTKCQQEGGKSGMRNRTCRRDWSACAHLEGGDIVPVFFVNSGFTNGTRLQIVFLQEQGETSS